MYKKFLLKFETSVINIILFIFIAFNIVSCSSDLNTKSSNDTETETAMSTFDKNIDLKSDYINDIIYNEKYGKIEYYNSGLNLDPIEIIIPRNQTISQSLSVVVTDNNGNLIVFDGGREDDAEYLCEIIKEKGGYVKDWFITHIHDDHIGALYKILNDKRTDIKIGTIVYSFADFDWYFEKMGSDAGILHIFENVIYDYNNYVDENNLDNHIGYIRNLSDAKNKYYRYENFEVFVLNDRYELDQDPINNTSIVYFIRFEKGQSMIILGDLGYEGGYKLFDDIEKLDDDLKNGIYNVDILQLAHHGQNGIDPILYKKFNKPEVVIWPTSKDIYENINGKYKTNETKDVIDNINSVQKQILTYTSTYIIN